MKPKNSSKKPIIFTTLFTIAFSLTFAVAPAHATQSINGLTTKEKNSLSKKEIAKKITNSQQIVVPYSSCNINSLPLIFSKVEKKINKKTLWFPYYNPKSKNPKKYVQRKRNTKICIATYKEGFFANPMYNQIEGRVLYSFIAAPDSNCENLANNVLENKSWRQIGNPELFGSCLVLGSEISPQEAMYLWRHPKTLSIEYDAKVSLD